MPLLSLLLTCTAQFGPLNFELPFMSKAPLSNAFKPSTHSGIFAVVADDEAVTGKESMPTIFMKEVGTTAVMVPEYTSPSAENVGVPADCIENNGVPSELPLSSRFPVKAFSAAVCQFDDPSIAAEST